MKKLMIFPINSDCMTIVEYHQLLDGYSVNALCSFKEDPALEVMREKYKELSVSSDENLVKESDTVLLLDNIGEFKLEKYQFLIEKAIKNAKKILLSQELYDEIGVDNSCIEFLENISCEMKFDINNTIKEIEIPVIGICGKGENCSKFESVLSVLNVLKEQEISYVALSENPLIKIFGGYNYPKEIFSHNHSLYQKILAFNNYIYDLCEEKNPDVLLVGIPGGITPFGMANDNYYSEVALVITNALKIDIGILNIYAQESEADICTELIKYCNYKYNMPIDLICMSRQKVVYNTESRRYETIYFNEETLHYLYTQYYDDRVINISDKKYFHSQIERIIEMLKDNVKLI